MSKRICTKLLFVTRSSNEPSRSLFVNKFDFKYSELTKIVKPWNMRVKTKKMGANFDN